MKTIENYQELIDQEKDILSSYIEDMTYKRIEMVGDLPFPDECLQINCAYDALDAACLLEKIETRKHLEASIYLIGIIEV